MGGGGFGNGRVVVVVQGGLTECLGNFSWP